MQPWWLDAPDTILLYSETSEVSDLLLLQYEFSEGRFAYRYLYIYLDIDQTEALKGQHVSFYFIAMKTEAIFPLDNPKGNKGWRYFHGNLQ